MAITYYGSRLSPHMDKTPEGFLICRDVPINRTGEQTYLARELGLEGDPDRTVIVRREPEDVFAPAALASFEAKDVTQGHPPEQVGPENHALYSKGHVQNVRRQGDFTVADLVVKDAALISDICNGVLREISCGYLCEYVPAGDGYRQTNIQGNHVAVVPKGRAGSTVSIKDAAQEAEKGRNDMSKFAEAILKAFGMAAKDASPEDFQTLVATAAGALDAETAGQQPPEEDVPQEETADAKLDQILELLKGGTREGHKEELRTEADLDEALKELTGEDDGEKAVVIPAAAADTEPSAAAKDAAALILRTMRPIVAAIRDEAVRSQVADAVLTAVQDPGRLAVIDAAAASSAKRAADQSAKTSYEKICADSEAAYAARNPHKRKERKG